MNVLFENSAIFSTCHMVCSGAFALVGCVRIINFVHVLQISSLSFMVYPLPESLHTVLNCIGSSAAAWFLIFFVIVSQNRFIVIPQVMLRAKLYNIAMGRASMRGLDARLEARRVKSTNRISPCPIYVTCKVSGHWIFRYYLYIEIY